MRITIDTRTRIVEFTELEAAGDGAPLAPSVTASWNVIDEAAHRWLLLHLPPAAITVARAAIEATRQAQIEGHLW